MISKCQLSASACVELVETVHRKAVKIGAQQCLVLARAMGFGRCHSARRFGVNEPAEEEEKKGCIDVLRVSRRAPCPMSRRKRRLEGARL